jgi:hypothetical protein
MGSSGLAPLYNGDDDAPDDNLNERPTDLETPK